MVFSVEKASKIFQDACVPKVYSANLDGTSRNDSENATNVHVVWEQDDLVELKKKKFSVQYRLDHSKFEQCGFPVEQNPEIILEALSPSKTKRAVIKKCNDNQKVEKLILEIWSNRKCMKLIDLSAFGKHGTIHCDLFFSSFSWSRNETHLLYIAEQKKNESDAAKFCYEESWGEMLYNISTPVICVFDVVKETLHLISSPSFDDISPLQPQWGPDQKTIIFCGLTKSPYRLGKFYCENRPCHIFMLTLNEEYEELSLVKISGTHSGISSNWCPRVNQLCSQVIYMHCELSDQGSPHVSHAELFCYDIVNQTTHKIPNKTGTDYYIKNFPSSIWFDDEIHIGIHEKNSFLVVNVQNGDVVSTHDNCTSLLMVEGNLAILSISSMNSKRIGLAIYDHKKETFYFDEEMAIHPMIETKKKFFVQVIPNVFSWALIPKNDLSQKIPLIVWAHGGPHTAFEDAYNNFTTAFCQLGYAVLMVNYTGSTGFGQESLTSLPGNIGSRDIQEVQAMVTSFMENNTQIDANNVFYFGGSHGGFIGAHLLGQHPHFYRAAVLRNPVIDIASMSMVTDIPDWCYFESGLPFNQGKIPSADDYAVMLSKSPIVNLQDIIAPIMICIGGKDERVPPSQGKAFYRLLKGNNKTVEMMFYPNASHPLKSVDIVGNFFASAARWFDKHKQV